MSSLVIKNIGTLATPKGRAAKRGTEQGEIEISHDAWISAEDGVIREIGTGSAPDADEMIDAGGRLVTPGLTDAHTHLVFGGWRQNELGKKLHGASYLDILAEGGGILSTVRATRSSTREELVSKSMLALDEMLSLGVTSLEAKSGYGLSTDEELKQLDVIRALCERAHQDIVPTFMGAHALPTEYKDDRGAYVDLICGEMIPAVAEHRAARYCDVFCERGAFTVEESERILNAGKAHGLAPKIHADEIESIGGSVLAGRVGAVSAEHLIVCPQEGIDALAAAGTVACLLPATSFYLGSTYAPAREMISAGVPVALASDFNPGSCPCLNIQLVINIACLKYRMTPEEVLTSVTLNAAAAIGLEGDHGSIEPGKRSDIAVWDAPDLDYICYRMGSSLVHTVIKDGRAVHHK